jgi:hypothetical protein
MGKLSLLAKSAFLLFYPKAPDMAACAWDEPSFFWFKLLILS